MALMYMAATAMPYGGSYLAHARTKGSKNGISTTPGYIAVGDKAKGRLVNGVYVYDTPTMTNTPKTLAKRAQNHANGTSSNSGRRVSNYELAARNYMLGNRSAGRRYLGNTGVGRAVTTAARNVSTAAQNVSRTASRTANNVANWATGDYARNQFQIARNANDREGMAYWQRQYDRTLPGMVDKMKEVGSKAWSDVKKGATDVFNKGKDFVTGLLGNIRSAVGRAAEFVTGRNARDRLNRAQAAGDSGRPGTREELERALTQYNITLPGQIETYAAKARDIAEGTWTDIKRAGRQVMEWGGRVVDKIVGTAQNVGRAVRTGAETAGRAIRTGAETAGRAIRTGALNTVNWVTGSEARDRLNSLTDADGREAIARAEQDYANTLPGRIGSAVAGGAQAANNVTQAASAAVQNASRTIGSGLQTVGQAVTTAGGQVIQTVVDAYGQAYQLVSDGVGNVINMIGSGGNGSSNNFTPHFTYSPEYGTVYEQSPGVYRLNDGTTVEAKGTATQPSSGNEDVITVNGIPVRIRR